MMTAEILILDAAPAPAAAATKTQAASIMDNADYKRIDLAFQQMLPVLHRTFARACSSREVEDLVAETRRWIIQKYDVGKAVSFRRLHPWIEKIGLNVLSNHRRTARRRQGHMDEVADANVSPRRGRVATPMIPFRTLRAGACLAAEDHDTPHRRVIEREQRELLWTCIRELGDPTLRLTVALNVGGLPGPAIADGLDMAYSTCYTHLQSAEKLLHELVRSLLHFRADPSLRCPSQRWTFEKDQAAREAWDWIWGQDEAGALTAMLALFGKLSWDALERFEFYLDVDWRQIELLESQLRAAGWN